MQLYPGNLYHVFNRGNNKQKIFLSPENYPYFLNKLKRFVLPYCDLIAWCLMPNHFHFLINANENSVPVKDGSFPRQQFSQGIKQLLSSYTKGVNKQKNRTGSLFQQKTKAICVSGHEWHTPETVFHYIHQNPMKAGLVARMEDWPYSSFREYLGGEGICNQVLAREILTVNFQRIYEESYEVIRDGKVSYAF